MKRIQIEKGFRLTLPEEFRGELKVGDELHVSVDRAGRIILLSEARIRETLRRTAGIWQDRTDVPTKKRRP